MTKSILRLIALPFCLFSITASFATEPAVDENLSTAPAPMASSVGSPLRREHWIDVGYVDAEAGFSGFFLSGAARVNESYNFLGEATLLSGHSFSYQHINLGAERFFARWGLFGGLQPSARVGLLYHTFDDKNDFGLKLGGGFQFAVTDALRGDIGLDWQSTGKNVMILSVGGRYYKTDNLYFQMKYWKSEFDELTLGIGFEW